MAQNIVAIAVEAQTVKFALWHDQTLGPVTQRPLPMTLAELNETLVAGFAAVRHHATVDGVAMSVTSDGVIGGRRYLDIRSELESLFTLPVLIARRTDCVALAEMVAGAGVGKQHVVVIDVNDDVEAAIVLDGQLWHGASALSGQLGFMLMKPQATLASIAAPRRIAERYLVATGEQLSGEAVFARASQRDTLAIRLVAEAEAALGKVIFNLQCVLAPERFVITGAVSGDVKFMDCVQAAVETVRAEVKMAPAMPEIIAGQYSGEASLRGAVANFMRIR